MLPVVVAAAAATAAAASSMLHPKTRTCFCRMRMQQQQQRQKFHAASLGKPTTNDIDRRRRRICRSSNNRAEDAVC
jgi:hypothetical protein